MFKPNTNQLVLAATITGATFECFDFFCFIFLSSIISELFFPEQSKFLRILFIYSTISISYVARPIGGIIFGHIADKYGRKLSLLISISLMVIPSIILIILPTYASIGITATVILLISRVFQGLSLGNEFSNAITYINEKFDSKKRFYYYSFIIFGSNFSIALGSFFIHLLIKYTSHDFLYSIGWRIPFVVGILLAIIGIYLRRIAEETPAFIEVKKLNLIRSVPFLTVIKEYKQEVIIGILASLIVFSVAAVFHLFLPSLLVNFYHMSLDHVSNISSLGALTLALSGFVFAYLYTNYNAIIVLRLFLTLLLVLFILIVTKVINLEVILTQKIYLFYFITVIVSFALASEVMVYDWLFKLFPTNVKVTGIGICFNFASILGGGLTPLWSGYIMNKTHNFNIVIGICILFVLNALIISFIIQKFTKFK